MADRLWGTISAQGVGAFQVRVRGVAYGFDIIYDEAPARTFRAFYVTKRASAAIILAVMFADRSQYQAFGDWLTHWGTLASQPTPTESVQNFLRITIPAIGFDKSGVLTDGVTFGTQAGEVVKDMVLRFIGALDASGDVNLSQASRFFNVSREVSAEIPYFYPAGIQLSGSQAGDDAIYEDPAYLKAAPLDAAPPSRGFGTGGRRVI